MMQGTRNKMTVGILTKLKQKGMPRGVAQPIGSTVPPIDLMGSSSDTSSPEEVAQQGAEAEVQENQPGEESTQSNDLLPLEARLRRQQGKRRVAGVV